MPKAKFRNRFQQEQFDTGENIVLNIPKQYQAQTVSAVVTFDMVVATATDDIKGGGLFNLIETIELLRSGSNQLFSSTGVLAAAWAGAKRKVNPADFIQIYDENANDFLTESQKDSIPTGTYKAVVKVPIDFAHYGGIRPSDTIYNLNTTGDTFQLRVKRAANANVFETPANITITNPTVELEIEQVQALRPSDGGLIPVVGQFIRGDLRDDLTVAQSKRIMYLPASVAYTGFMLAMIDPANNNVDDELYDVVDDVKTAIAQNVYQQFTPNLYRTEYPSSFGEWTKWKWSPGFLPVLFTRQTAGAPDRLSDVWITAGSQDIQLQIEHSAKASRNLVCFYEQFLPYDPNWVSGLLNSQRAA